MYSDLKEKGCLCFFPHFSHGCAAHCLLSSFPLKYLRRTALLNCPPSLLSLLHMFCRLPEWTYKENKTLSERREEKWFENENGYRWVESGTVITTYHWRAPGLSGHQVMSHPIAQRFTDEETAHILYTHTHIDSSTHSHLHRQASCQLLTRQIGTVCTQWT